MSIKNIQDVEKNKNLCEKFLFKIKLKYYKLSLFITIVFLGLLCSGCNNINLQNDLFQIVGQSSKLYAGGGGIFDLGDEQYIILGGTNKTSDKYHTVPMPEKTTHYEIFDNKIKKIIETSDDILYGIFNSVQLDNGDLFINNCTNNENEINFFSIIYKDTKEVKNLISANKLFNEPYLIKLIKLNENKVLILNNNPNIKENAYIYDGNTDSFTKAPNFAKKIYSKIDGIGLNRYKYVLIGGNSDLTTEKRYTPQEIEICDIKKNKCILQKSILNDDKPILNIFKNKDDKVILIRQYRDEECVIELFDPENDTIEIIGTIPNDGIRDRKFTQLKDGNFLITGGHFGIMVQGVVDHAYIFNVNKKELIKLPQNMNFKRGLYQQTKVLNDGNVLICGGSSYKENYCELFITNKIMKMGE